MTKQIVRFALIATALGLVLAACSSKSDMPGTTAMTPATPTTTTAVQEDQFGSVFGMDFRAVANTEPANVSDTDIVAVSLTTEPAAITP